MKLLFLLIFILSVLAGCTTTKYIPAITSQKDSIYITNIVRDTTAVRDSIYIERNGDTLTVERWHTIYKSQLLHDTIASVCVDSVRVPYPVEKQLTKWQQFKLDFGGHVLVVLVVMVLFIIIWILRRKLL